MKRSTLVFLALLTFVAACAYGCAALQGTDPATGRSTGKIDDAKVTAAQQAISVGGSIFGPIGSAVGIGLAGVIGAYAAKKKGEETGYNQGSLDAGRPLASAGAKPQTGVGPQ